MALIKLPKMKFNLRKLLPFKAIRKLRIRPERKVWDGKTPLKIGFYTDTYLPNVDGVVNALISYRDELELRGNTVYVYTSGTEKDEREFGNDKTFFFESLVFPPYPQYKVAVFPFTSMRYVQKSKVELIHSHAIASMGFAAIASAKALNLPLVGTFHTMVPKATFYITKNSFGKRIFSEVAWQAIKQFYAPYDLVTAPTRTIEKLLNENGVSRTAVVPNGINTQKFSQNYDGTIVKKLLGIKPEEKIILTSGRLSQEKNVHILIKAFEKVRKSHKAKLIIQGDGPARQGWQKIAKKGKYASDIIFTGFVKDYEVPFFYACADVFATASTFETQGLAMLESMACGKISVGANSLAIPEMLHSGENGYLFKPFDETDCAEKLQKVLDLKESERKRMSQNARKIAMTYSIEKSTDKLMDAYRQVL